YSGTHIYVVCKLQATSRRFRAASLFSKGDTSKAPAMDPAAIRAHAVHSDQGALFPSPFFRFCISNRVTYEELEPHATRTKQTVGPISNRVFLRLLQTISSRFRTPAARPSHLFHSPSSLAGLCPLTTDHSLPNRQPKLLENRVNPAPSITSRFLTGLFT
ncbi:MAG: hypothetical protein WA563_17300, partial [Candidatus Acidiferrales bacterium]